MVQRGSLLKQKNKSISSLIYGGIAGCISRTCVAPFDKIKILMQFQNSNLRFTKFFINNVKQEGILNMWKGNGTNLIRIFPYSGLQFMTYDLCKEVFLKDNRDTTTQERLLFGTISGVVATTFTHPVDVLRHRLMCYPNITSLRESAVDLYKENKFRGFFKGYGSTVISLTPFIALNFTIFDCLKDKIPDHYDKTDSRLILGMGAFSALISQTACYPLDTIRRRMQNKTLNYKNGFEAGKVILKTEGILSFYKGMLPNVLRMVPNTAIRFAIFDYLKDKFN